MENTKRERLRDNVAVQPDETNRTLRRKRPQGKRNLSLLEVGHKFIENSGS
jgi:hypothetical protein